MTCSRRCVSMRRAAPWRASGPRCALWDFAAAVLAELGAALDEPVAEAVLYARAYVDADTTWSESVLNLRDTPSGRVALYRLSPPQGSHQEWMAIAPATSAQIHHAVTTVLGSVAGAVLGQPRTDVVTK